MSTQEKPGWTLETLKALMDERDIRYQQRADLDAKAVSAALAAAEKAVQVAETNSEKWRMNANEWRASMLDRERQFFSKSMGYIIGVLTILSIAISLVGKLA